jgi:integrase
MARLGIGTRKRSDGTLEKRFTINGKRYSVYGKNTKEISAKEQELRKQIEAGLYTENRKIILDNYFDEWIKRKRNNVKSNTLKSYVSVYKKHISPVLGGRKVQHIERREIIELQIALTKKVGNGTNNRIISVVRTIFDDAIKDDIIAKNPARDIDALKESKKATETFHRALTEEEQSAFMQELSSDYYYEFIALLLCSGMRYGEAAALCWNDIDYKDNVIHITKTVTYSEDGELILGNTPKSKAGKRDIPLTDTIKRILVKQRAKHFNVVPMGNNSVFSTVYGGLVHNHAINRAIASALERLEAKGVHIERFTAHALRDTFATRFIEQGGNPQTLKTLLGHTSYSMTMDLYSHVLPNTKQKEMDNIHIAI